MFQVVHVGNKKEHGNPDVEKKLRKVEQLDEYSRDFSAPRYPCLVQESLHSFMETKLDKFSF